MSRIYGAADDDVPHYFLCPISLQIMTDPVTTATGITYDRPSIEAWLSASRSGHRQCSCPVTNQPLSDAVGSGLTPNHTLRRLIQAWCTLKGRGEEVSTPQEPADPSKVARLLGELGNNGSRRRGADAALAAVERLASESECNRRCMARSGAAASLGTFISSCSRADRWDLVERALKVFSLISRPKDQQENADVRDVHALHSASDIDDLSQALTRFLLLRKPTDATCSFDSRTHAMLLLESLCRSASAMPRTRTLELLKPEFFSAVVVTLRDAVSPSRTPSSSANAQRCLKASLHVLQLACPLGRNRAKAAEAGAVEELLEVLLSNSGGKRAAELALGVLDLLCACAEGRSRLLAHAAGIAVIAKKVLRVTPVGDERAVGILAAVARCCAGKRDVLREMLTVGAVSKLCMVMQADCSKSVKDMARGVLRMHSNVWANSPCIAMYLLTRYPQN